MSSGNTGQKVVVYMPLGLFRRCCDSLGDQFRPGFFRYRSNAIHGDQNCFPNGYILYERLDTAPSTSGYLTVTELLAGTAQAPGIVKVESSDEITKLKFGENGDLLKNYAPEDSDEDKCFVRDEIYAVDEFTNLVLPEAFLRSDGSFQFFYKAWQKQEHGSESVSKDEVARDKDHLVRAIGIEKLLGKDDNGNPIGIADPENRKNWLKESIQTSTQGTCSWQGFVITLIRGYIQTFLRKETGLQFIGEKNKFPNKEYRTLMGLLISSRTNSIPEYIGSYATATANAECGKLLKAIKSYQNRKYSKIAGGTFFEDLWKKIKQELRNWKRTEELERWGDDSHLASLVIVIGFDLFMYMKETLQIPVDFLEKPFFSQLSKELEQFQNERGGSFDASESGYCFQNEAWQRDRDALLKRRFRISTVINFKNLDLILNRIFELNALSTDDSERITKLFRVAAAPKLTYFGTLPDAIPNESAGVQWGNTREIEPESRSLVVAAIPIAIDKPLEQIAVLADLWVPSIDLEKTEEPIHDSDVEEELTDVESLKKSIIRTAFRASLPEYLQTEYDEYITLEETQRLPPLGQRTGRFAGPSNSFRKLHQSGWAKLIGFLGGTFDRIEAISVGAERIEGCTGDHFRRVSPRLRKRMKSKLLGEEINVVAHPNLGSHAQDPADLLDRVPSFLSRLEAGDRTALLCEMAWMIHLMDNQEFQQLQQKYRGLSESVKDEMRRRAYKKILNYVLPEQLTNPLQINR